MSIVCALSAIGRYILRARRPEERRRDKAKIQLYPIFAKKIPYGAYGVSGRSMPKGNGGYGAGSAVSGDREKAEAGDGGVLPPPRGAPCRPAGMRHGTGREPGHGMDANTMAASRDIPGLCPEIATAERESAEFYYLCGAGPPCRCRPRPGEESPGNTEHRAS